MGYGSEINGEPSMIDGPKIIGVCSMGYGPEINGEPSSMVDVPKMNGGCGMGYGPEINGEPSMVDGPKMDGLYYVSDKWIMVCLAWF